MSIRRVVPILITIAMLLAGCAGATPAATLAPTMTNVPTTAPTSMPTLIPTDAPSATIVSPTPTPAPATAAASPTTTAVPTTAPVATTAASDVNDATHARLRVALFDKDGPNTDFLVNGAVAVNGGQPQVNIPAGYFTAYLYLAPGTYSVAIPPTGQAAATALVSPVNVSVVAGHRYTLILMGQITNKSLKPLLIDETEAAQKVGASTTDTTVIVPNNLAGAPGLAVAWDDKMINANIPFGGFGAGIYAPGNGHIHLAVAGDTTQVLFDDPADWREPGVNHISGLTGSYPGALDSEWTIFDSAPYSDLNPFAFLRGFSGKNLRISDNPTSFDTLLSAIKTAGLTDMYTNDGPFLILAPTDAAFAAMPKDQRDALLADPATLTKLLRAHTFPGYFPRGSLSQTPGGTIQRTLNNLDGGAIAIGGGFTINGAQLGEYDS